MQPGRGDGYGERVKTTSKRTVVAARSTVFVFSGDQFLCSLDPQQQVRATNVLYCICVYIDFVCVVNRSFFSLKWDGFGMIFTRHFFSSIDSFSQDP